MKIKIIPHRLALIAGLALTTVSVQAWDFSYGYQNVFSPNATTYIVSQQNVTRFTENYGTPATYWGPTGNGVQGLLTSRFNFSAPTTEIHLDCRLTAFNWTTGPGVGSGIASLWGSKDGASWQLLLDESTFAPGAINKDVVYDQDVPSTLCGGNSFWLQVRMQESNTGYGYANAQFGRVDGVSSANSFQLNVAVVPEPSTLSLGLVGALAGLIGWARMRRR